MSAPRALRAPARRRAPLAGVLAAVLALCAADAAAQCLPAVPMTGDTVTCTGTLNFGYAVPGGVDEITLIIDVGTVITTIGNGVMVNQGSTVENRGDLTVTGISSAAVFGGGVAAGPIRGVITNVSGASVTAAGDQSTGLSGGIGTDIVNESGALVTVTGQGANGIGAEIGSTISNQGSVVVLGTAATGLSVVSGAGNRQSTLTNEATGSVVVDGQDAVGMAGGASSIVTNLGTITGSGVNAVGVRSQAGAFIDQAGTITMSGDSSRGVGTGQAARSVNTGTITMTGDNAIGMNGVAGLAADAASRTRVENDAGGRILVTGSGAAGLASGQFGHVRNLGDVDVQGTMSSGIRTGIDSIAENGGVIRVSAPDAVGIDADNFDPATYLTQQSPNFYNVWNRFDPSVGAAGLIESTDPDAGALVTLRNTTASGINRVRNDEGAVLRADLTNVGTPGRGLAILGSPGTDVVENAGHIEGLVDLGDGDDVWNHVPTGTLAPIPGFVPVDGGAGNDEIHLGNQSAALQLFAPDFVTNFENIRIQGYWGLSAPTPAGLGVVVDPGGVFRVDSPTRIMADFSFAAPAPGQAAGALQVLVDPTTNGLPELLMVDGTATLDDGVLDVFVPNGFSGQATVTVLRAGTDMVGRFAGVSLPSDPSLAVSPVLYDDTANTATVNVSAQPFTPNQAATRDYLGRVEATGPPSDLQNILDGINSLDFTSYRDALAQLHPEPYDAHTATTLELAYRYTQLMIERPRYCVVARDQRRSDPRTQLPCRERRFEPWAAVYGQLGNRTGTSDHISYDDQGAGLVVGLDHRANDRLLFTGTVGGAYDALTVDGIGSGRIKTIDLGLYAGYTHGRTRVQGVVSYGHGWQTQYRNLRLPGFARTADAAWSTNRVGTRLEGEYLFDLGAFDVIPLASLDYTVMLQDAFGETGARPVTLAVAARTDHVVTLRAGAELTAPLRKRGYWTELLEVADGIWRPTVSVRWRQVLTGSERPITASFIGVSDAAAGTFTVTGDAPEQGFEIGAGIDWTPARSDRLTVGVRYDVFVWSDVTSHDLVARVRLGF